MSPVAVGSERPSHLAMCLYTMTFLCEKMLPNMCRSIRSSIAFVALVHGFLVLLAWQIWLGVDRRWLYYVCMTLLCLLSFANVLFFGFVAVMSRFQLKNRIQANPTAWHVVEKGLENKRIIRNEQYDVYLPPSPPPSKGKNQYPVGFLMLPGALLEHNAYAGILSKISDENILVMIQNCEPARVACEGLGSGEEDVKQMIQHLAQTHGISAAKWSIGGHSMGGYTATMIAKKCDYFDSLVLYGCNKSYNIEKTSIRALALTASNDGFLVSPSSNLSTFDCWGKSDTKGKLLHVVIEGGNHSGFGDYSRQTFPLPDGERTIPLEEQHRQVVDITTSFLMQKNN